MAVVRPSSADDVAALVRSAFGSARSRFPVSARGHGHSTNGQALALGGVIVEMSCGIGPSRPRSRPAYAPARDEHVKLVDPEAFPVFHAWLREFEAQTQVKETIPAIDKLLEYARGIRQMMLSLSNGAAGGDSAPPAAAAGTSINNNIAVDAVDGGSG
ncbi:hypothetical protein Cni_G17503 [Canna indica]|uniref:FAD linked oxidase N-terminal domain-containing protein n=1 Tax=Canna indica TaxID=4628 RepID=A0AAQ3KJB9_9LILI|nr:hypothetical protein Cni_G17503 [Canna indica]